MTDAEFIQEVIELIVSDDPADCWSKEELLDRLETLLEELVKLQTDHLNLSIGKVKKGNE